MIEGLRVLPWFQDALKETPGLLDPCDVCMRDTTPEIRQQMGCGYLPAIDDPPHLWYHRGMDDEEQPKYCPMYTTSLPEVHDVALAVGSCGQGGLATLPVLCGGTCPPRALIQGCQILNGAIASQQSWKNDPKNREK